MRYAIVLLWTLDYGIVTGFGGCRVTEGGKTGAWSDIHNVCRVNTTPLQCRETIQGAGYKSAVAASH